jgi:hypothetical protein
MIAFALMIAVLVPDRWDFWHKPIKSPTVCMSEYQQRLARCAVEHPDAQSLQRAVCEADARGQYTACIGGLQ